MSELTRIFGLITLLAIHSPGMASSVFKCTGANGEMTFSFAPCAVVEPSAVVNKEPSAGFNKEPSAGFNKEPSAGFLEEPSAGFNKEPSAGFLEEPSASFNKEPSAGYLEEPSAGYLQEPLATSEPVPVTAALPAPGTKPATSRQQRLVQLDTDIARLEQALDKTKIDYQQSLQSADDARKRNQLSSSFDQSSTELILQLNQLQQERQSLAIR